MTISVPTSLELVSTNVVPIINPEVGNLSDKTTISTYSELTEIIGTNGAVYQNSNTISLGTPTNITSGAVSVYTGITSSAVIKSDGSLWMAGSNTYGEHGIGNTTSTARNTYVDTGLRNVKQVVTSASGSAYTLALLNDGTLWFAGKTYYGIAGPDKLGTYQSLSFVKVNLSKKVKLIASPPAASCSAIIVYEDNTIAVSGENEYAILGDGTLGTVVNGYTPITVNTGAGSSVPKYILISGSMTAFILMNDGKLYASGSSTNALGVTPVGYSFTLVPNLPSIKHIVSSGSHSFAIDFDGNIYATGNNSNGQLGLGDTTTRSSFTQVTSVPAGKCYGISAGSYTTYYITQLNDLYFAGNKFYTNLIETNPTNQSALASIDTTRNYRYSENLEAYYATFTYEDADYEYSVENGEATVIGASNPKRPFDSKNYSIATATTTMTYIVKGLVKFDTLALGRVKADSATVVFKNSLGATVTSITRAIDTSRDDIGNLEKWHTTEIYYSTETMEAGSMVEITLTGTTIELGTILLGMSVAAGFSKLEMSHSYKDFSVAEYDVWGNLDYVERQRINTYNGSVDVDITDYDKTVRLMTSLGKQLVIVNGSTSKTMATDSQSVFASTQKIGRFMSFSSKTKIKESDLDAKAEYNFTLEELA